MAHFMHQAPLTRTSLKLGLVKIVPNLSPLPRRASTEKSLVRILPLVRKLLTLKRWIIGQILNFRDENFLGGPHLTLGCALARLGQSLARVKLSVSGLSTPYGPKYSLQKKVHQGVNLFSSITFSFVDQSTQTFLSNVGGLQIFNSSSDFRYVDSFRRYWRSQSKVVKNRATFGRFVC